MTSILSDSAPLSLTLNVALEHPFTALCRRAPHRGAACAALRSPPPPPPVAKNRQHNARSPRAANLIERQKIIMFGA
jgi:hypothetical protein